MLWALATQRAAAEAQPVCASSLPRLDSPRWSWRLARDSAATHPELEPSPPSGAATDAIEMLLEHLCSLFYRHRWSLKHAFEYFDANGDGVLTPEEFSTALTALSSLKIDDPDMDGGDSSSGEASRLESLRLTPEQTETLVASLDRNADGVIDYEEFLLALQARDTMQM